MAKYVLIACELGIIYLQLVIWNIVPQPFHIPENQSLKNMRELTTYIHKQDSIISLLDSNYILTPKDFEKFKSKYCNCKIKNNHGNKSENKKDSVN